MGTNTNKLIYIPASLFGIISLIILFVDQSNFASMLVFTLITAVPFILGKLIPNNIFKSRNATRVLETFYFSIFFFYFGYFFSLTYNSPSPPSYFTNGLALVVVIAIYIVIMFGIFVFWALSKDSLANKSISYLIEKNNIQIHDFLKIAKDKNANILAVAGNLKALKSNEGITLLKEFLASNSANNLELFIPEDSESYMSELKRKLGNENDTKRVKYSVIEPFIFMQGIVFAGQKIPTDSGEGISTKGYYLYKPILSDKDEFSDKGIFIDVSDLPEEDNYCAAIASYYRHLNNKDFRLNGFVYKPGIFKIDAKNKQQVFNHIKKTKTLDQVS